MAASYVASIGGDEALCGVAQVWSRAWWHLAALLSATAPLMALIQEAPETPRLKLFRGAPLITAARLSTKW